MWSLRAALARGASLRASLNSVVAPAGSCALASPLFASLNSVVAPAGSRALASPPFSFVVPEETKGRGLQIVHDPWSNKGTGHPLAERDRLRIRGLVPPRTLTLDVQAQKIMHSLALRSDPLDKHSFLTDLQDRNATLFFRVLIDNLEELSPIIYTPTVGAACLRFGSIFRRAVGMYFASQDRGQLASMAYNWPHNDVEIIVVTDGSRILGLGDLGANGMGIPIGKLALYVAAGGISPRKVLPVLLDLGTDNTALQNDPWYLGMSHSRLRGDEYYSMVHEFVHACRHRWPHALIQFEDFSSDKASNILDAYRHDHLCFNDDIQGTGAVTLGALLAAVRTQGPSARLSDQRIVICGAGSAGMGVATAVAAAMSAAGFPADAARQRFWVCDKDGLLGPGRTTSAGVPLSSVQASFTRRAGDDVDPLLRNGAPLADVVRAVAPTILLGFTGKGGTFTEPIIRDMTRRTPHRPIIFPLSNPTALAECTAEQAYAWTDGRAVFGCGSPFAPVTLPDGRVIAPSQVNNMFIFPAIGAASVAVRPKRITDSMFHAAALAMAACVSEEDLANGRVVPRVRDIRRVTAAVAAAAAQSAITEGIAQRMPPAGNLQAHIAASMWNPTYNPLVNSVYGV